MHREFHSLKSAPNLQIIVLKYANGAEIFGTYSRVDDTVSTLAGAPQSRGDFWRWAPIQHAAH